ncbi:hypothetical protein ACSBR2_021951 [Camellia fascicularis]
MDNEVASSRKKKNDKVDSSKQRRIWSPHEEDALILALVSIVNEGMKVDNAFKAGYLVRLETKLADILPGTDLRGCPHIESKIKIWKKHYNSVSGMLATSGFGWNDTKKRIDVKSDSTDTDAKHLRNKTFPYFDEWIQIFGKDRATGEFAEGPVDAVEAMNAEEDVLLHGLANNDTFLEQMGVNSHTGEGMDCSNSATQRACESSTKKKDKKRSRSDDDVLKEQSMFADKLVDVMGKTNEKLEFIRKRMGYSHDVASKRASLNDELTKLPIAVDES